MVTTAILMSSTLPAEEVFSLEHLRVKIPSYSRILASRICAKCGEKIMETKAVMRGKSTTAYAAAKKAMAISTGPASTARVHYFLYDLEKISLI